MKHSDIMDQLRDELRRRNYSYRTEQAYTGWIKRLLKFCEFKHPMRITPDEITRFLNYLAIQRNVSASTQNQALCAIVFLYREILDQDLPHLENLKRAKRPKHLPVVLARGEVKRVMEHMDGLPELVALLLYGSGLRISEALRLRI